MTDQRPPQWQKYPHKTQQPTPPPKKDIPQHDEPDCAEPEPPCPEPDDCPVIPERPCPPVEPEPCVVEPPSETDPCDPLASSEPEATTPADQLKQLRKRLEDSQRALQRYEPLKASIADVTERIEALEKTIDGQATVVATYTKFYNEIERYASEVSCAIPTVRCQLDLKEKHKTCVRDAIAAIEARITKAKADRDAQEAEVKRLERNQKVLDAELAWATKWRDFFATGLQQQIEKQRDDLKALNTLADPAKDHCEAWFYLNEMEAILNSARTTAEGEVCYSEGLNLGTFITCWSPDCYAAAYEHWIVAFNSADGAAKLGKIQLTEATNRKTALDAAATEAETKRREWILKEIKVQGCCDSLSKCP
jgi:hypothetical protein